MSFRFTISKEQKKQTFEVVNSSIQAASGNITMWFYSDATSMYMRVQGYDASNQCMYDLTLDSTWFQTFVFTATGGKPLKLTVSATAVKKLFTFLKLSHTLEMAYDIKTINGLRLRGLLSDSTVKHELHLPLLTNPNFGLSVVPSPSVSAVQCTFDAFKILDSIRYLSLWGDNLTFQFTAQGVSLSTNGSDGEAVVYYGLSDIKSYVFDTQTANVTYTISMLQATTLCFLKYLYVDNPSPIIVPPRSPILSDTTNYFLTDVNVAVIGSTNQLRIAYLISPTSHFYWLVPFI